MNEAWEQCDNPEWMFWILEKFGETSKLDAVAIAILFACSILHLAKDDSAVEAILAAEKWRLDPSKINSDLAYSASKAAYNAGNRTDVCDYPSAACLFAAFRAAATAWACGHANANFWGHVDSCATAVRWTAKNSEERANINKANCQIVREVVANPFL